MAEAGLEVDYVVVGAGSAGCVIAARLSEDPGVKVVLLEAGGEDTSFWIHTPIGYGKTIVDGRINWKYETEPDPGINNRTMYWPRGKVLGGTSSINGLLYIRGQAADYDHWRQLGNAGWAYDDVLPYFRRSEDQANGESEFHGTGGPLAVANLVERNPLCEAFIGAATSLGIPRNDDFNGADQEGVGYYQLTTRRAKRCSAAVAFLRPAMKRPNLRVETRALAERIILEGKRAVGVRYRQNGRAVEVRARREVIVSGGAINSPQLLLLSGIGPGAHLREVGVEVAHDLPGVGRNLQDHCGTGITYRSAWPVTINDIMANPLKQLQVGLQYLLTRTGPLTISAAQVGLFTRSAPEVATPDIQFLFQTFSGDSYDAGLHRFSGFCNVFCATRPESRGMIGLKSADPTAAPLMRPNYLSAEKDMRVLLAAMKLARRIAERQPLAAAIVEEHGPGPGVATDDQIVDFLRATALSIQHMCGTCKMGTDEHAVVDPTLRVHGMDGLRVADASIMPTLVSGNTNAPTIMIGERAADFIRRG